MRLEKPILMSGPMVRANRMGDKQETRRLAGLHEINEQPDRWTLDNLLDGDGENPKVTARFRYLSSDRFVTVTCPYGAPGTTLWVREHFYVGKGYNGVKPRDLPPPGASLKVWYEADGQVPDWCGFRRISLHMPYGLSRNKLLLKTVGLERVGDLTEAGAKREGMVRGWLIGPINNPTQFIPHPDGTYMAGFRWTWQTLNDPKDWVKNNWVWVLNYKPLTND